MLNLADTILTAALGAVATWWGAVLTNPGPWLAVVDALALLFALSLVRPRRARRRARW